MIQDTILTIRLTRGVLKPRVGDTSVNEFCGGPETLLGWLETQLGLAVGAVPKANRITEYAGALDAVSASSFHASMATDRWATASALLSRRDELLLAGWDESESDSLPPLVRDLARAAAGRTFVFPGEATRLQRALTALEQGQLLPPHRCILADPPEVWPTLWGRVLAKLTLATEPERVPLMQDGTALRSAQTHVRGAPRTNIVQDSTLRYVVTRSEAAACEFVAAALAFAPDKLSTTVIYCENDSVALRLDACLKRIGLPTTGASIVSPAHPVLQVLPLTLSLCWEPVDPQALLGFLTLPVMPLSRRIASRLASSLAEEPGLGSGTWEEAVAEFCNETDDPDGAVRARLDAWLLCERVPRGQPIASRLIRERCNLVAQWAAGRAMTLAGDPSAKSELVLALQRAAGHASVLGDLVESQGSSVTAPQLGRLLDEALSNGVESTPCVEAAGGPVRVRSLAEIDAPCSRLIWLGLGTADMAGCRWSASQLQQLRTSRIDLDDGSRELSALRSKEARGYAFVQDSFLAVLLPRDWEQRWHPIWLAIRTGLTDCENPPVLEDLIAAGQREALSPFVFAVNESDVEPPQMVRPTWHIPTEYLRERETVSATELEDRLACPLKWVLKHQAKLYPSPIAEIPDNHRLMGTFCHSVLERVFDGGGPLPTPDDAAALIGRVFDERLPLDAAPLAQTDQLMERRKLRDELVAATRVLVNTLSAGGYRIVGIEMEVSGDAFGKSLNGWIDCLAIRDDGQEAIVDFKYAGRNKYHELIRDGRAVQLATYAYSRSLVGGTFPAVAYLVLSEAQLHTAPGSPLAGNGSVIDAPAIQTVWEQFSTAIQAADGWLTSGEPIPARPLQESSHWPRGAAIVLDVNLPANDVQNVCKYCNYKHLCGLQRTS